MEFPTAGPSTNDAPAAAKRENPCTAAWGNCNMDDLKQMAYFGKPTSTPHTCMGGRRHKAKLHKCEKCGFLGAPIQPLAFTRAGQEMIALAKRAAQERVDAAFAALKQRAESPEAREALAKLEQDKKPSGLVDAEGRPI